MSEYYVKEDGDIFPLRVAKAQDIHTIQSHITTALNQIIIDNLGDAFILDDEEDSFKLTPIEDVSSDEIIDQQNLSSTNWKELIDLYVTQDIITTKSSIENIHLKFRNVSESAINVTVEILNPNNEYVVEGSYTLSVPGNTVETAYKLPFNLHHLAPGNYTIRLKRTNIRGLQVKYDSNGSYLAGMSESPDDDTYNNIGGDLWFIHEYAGQSSFNITRGLAIVQANKIYSVDTHITIPPVSAYGDRIDLVTMDKSGFFNVYEGEPSTHPIAPDEVDGELVIAYVTSYRNEPLATDMDVDQDETLRHTRLRSLKHRITDLENMTNYIMSKNSPKRIKYNLTGQSMMDLGSSTNVAWDSVKNAFVLSNSSSVDVLFGLDTGVTLNNTTYYTEDKTVRLKRHSYQGNYYDAGHQGRKRELFNSKVTFHKTYKGTSYLSRYFAGVFKLGVGGNIYDISIQEMGLSSGVDKGRIGIWEYENNKEWVLRYSSDWVKAANFAKPGSNKMTKFNFSDVRYLSHTKTWAWVLEFKLKSGYETGTATTTTWKVTDTKGFDSKWNNTYAQFEGPGPYISGLKTRPGRGIGFKIHQSVNGWEKEGTITSDIYDAGAGISTVTMDINIILQEGTSYKLEVSNDGGGKFYEVKGNKYNFSNKTGSKFVWRITLRANSNKYYSLYTPEIAYSETKKYAIKASLGITTGTGNTSGDLYSIPFYGPGIIAYALGYQESTTEEPNPDVFSHWDWLRLWCEENDGEVSVSFESSNDGSIWNRIVTGLSLEDIGQEATLFGDAVDFDEYNYWCDVDVEILTDSEVVQSCETAWTADDLGVTCTRDSSNKVEGTYSAKMAIGSDVAENTLIAHQEKLLSLINYDWIEIKILSSVELDEGDFQFLVASDEDCTEVIEAYSIPAVSTGAFRTFQFKIQNPEDMAAVKSFGIKQIVDKGALDINIDAIKAIKLGITTLDSGETAWSVPSAMSGKVTSTAVSTPTPAAGSHCQKISLVSDPSTGLLVYKTKSPGLNMSPFDQIRMYLKSDTALGYGDLSLVLASNSSGTTILEEHSLPAIPDDDTNWKRINFDLIKPRDLDNIQSIGIKLNNGSINSGNFYVDEIQGVTTRYVPFYQKYVRMVFHLTRLDGDDISPTIHKIGVIPTLT